MMRKLIPKDVDPAYISTSYSHNKDKYEIALKLSEKEQEILSNLGSDGFHKCDTPLLYKLCQYYNFVSAPSEGWGKFNYKLRNIGDAVEAIVKLRYDNVHNPQDFMEISGKMVEIINVFNKELPKDAKFEDTPESFCADILDHKYCEEFECAFKQILEEVKNGTNSSYRDDVLNEDEPMCLNEDYDPNVLKKPMVLSPELFKNTGKDPQTEIKYINEFTRNLCNKGILKRQDIITSLLSGSSFLSKSIKAVQEWKKHLLRSFNQDTARSEILHELSKDEVLVERDWAMKFLPMRYRQSQSKWFGKRGLNWHDSVGSYHTSDTDDLKMQTIIHVFDNASQDARTSNAVLRNTLQQFQQMNPSLKKAYIRSDNAGCFRGFLAVSEIALINEEENIKVVQMDFADPQGGNSICDRRAAHIKSAIRKYVNEGHDVTCINIKKNTCRYKFSIIPS